MTVAMDVMETSLQLLASSDSQFSPLSTPPQLVSYHRITSWSGHTCFYIVHNTQLRNRQMVPPQKLWGEWIQLSGQTMHMGLRNHCLSTQKSLLKCSWHPASTYIHPVMRRSLFWGSLFHCHIGGIARSVFLIKITCWWLQVPGLLCRTTRK